MRWRLFNSAVMLLLIFHPLHAQSPAIEKSVDSLLHLMTVDEKCGQLVQIPADWSPERGSYLTEEHRAMVKSGAVGSLLNMTGAAAVAEAQKVAVQESRLHIPLIVGLDVIHGYRTIVPVPIGEASSWDPQLAERTARMAATEASAAGIHWTFAPMVDLARDPRWGRIVEGSGEDPYLGSVMAAARVRGFQGTSLRDPASILACAKHFAAYGGAEGGRDYNTVELSERTLRDYYLPPYRAAVEAGAGSVMSSFNEIGGIPSTASRFLLTDVLRNEWHFEGFVVSDWTAIEELQRHGIAANRADAGRIAIDAGLDMDMVSRIYQTELPALVREGKVAETVLDEAVRRVLRIKYRLGLFADPTRGATPEREAASMVTPEHRKLALESARQSIVMLKNASSTLPLSPSIRTLAVIGPLADDSTNPLGPWNGKGEARDVVTVLAGIRSHVSPGTRVLYAKGCEIEKDSAVEFEKAAAAAEQADAVVLVLGESEAMSGEAASRGNLDLPGRQSALLSAATAYGKPAILVLMNGRPLTIGAEADKVSSILEAWFPGVEAGNAVADILFGAVSPSGKLPVTFPRTVGQVPLYYNHKNTGRPFADSDKYTSKYLDIPVTPLYPFGHGLSYTTFFYDDLKIARPRIGLRDTLVVSVRVRNTGKRAGDEIVQWYVQDLVASVTRPVKELKGFARISLPPGEEKTVSCVIPTDRLAFYDATMNRVVEPGEFKVYVGGNSVDLLEAPFEIAR